MKNGLRLVSTAPAEAALFQYGRKARVATQPVPSGIHRQERQVDIPLGDSAPQTVERRVSVIQARWTIAEA